MGFNMGWSLPYPLPADLNIKYDFEENQNNLKPYHIHLQIVITSRDEAAALVGLLSINPIIGKTPGDGW